MRPLIGITLALDDRGRWRADRDTLYLDCAYASAVARAGGLPVYLPIQEPASALVDRVDGVVFPGGDDFLPPHPYPDSSVFRPASPRQVEFDSALLAAARERGLPALGICYGMQLLALRGRGRLHHHLPSDVPDARDHQLGRGDERHRVEIVAGSVLAELVGKKSGIVNSRHHQAVADPGPGLRVSARAEDGIIEAIEAVDGPWCVGVQWHPETLEGHFGQRLFEGFVARCRPRDRSCS